MSYQAVPQDDGPERLTCPRLTALCRGQAPAPAFLPLMKLDVTVDVHIATAFVSLEATFHNATPDEVDCMFEIPMSVRNVVTSAVAELGLPGATGADVRIFETQVVESSLLEQQQQQQASQAGGKGGDNAIKAAGARFGARYDEYNPEVFRMPFYAFAAGESAVLKINYFEDLKYNAGNYEIRVPMTIPVGMAVGGDLHQVISVHCAINAGTPDCQWGCASHQMDVMHQEVSRIVLQTKADVPMPNGDFVINYNTHTNAFLNHLIVEQPQLKPDEVPEDQWDGRGSFCLFMAPPQAGGLPKSFGRNIVFLLDRSGSMAGETIRRAVDALVTALRALDPDDNFWCCAFDHDQLWFSLTNSGQVRGVEGPQPPLGVAASAQNVEAAVNWVSQVDVRGLTDIMTPIVSSVSVLRSIYDREAAASARDASAPPPHVPLVVLVTDGAVADERQICQYMRQNCGPVRCFTSGIGPFCNRYFLRMLAQLGRGYSEMALKTTDITEQMTTLMARTCNPVLADITLAISQLEACELYPFPIPDLYGGSPIVLAGKFSGTFPPTITVRGRLGDGAMYEEVVQAYYTQYVPINKVFVKLRLDLLVATAWLASGKEAESLRDSAVKLSVTESMPCPYTNTVVYETNEERKNQHAHAAHGTSATALALGGVVALGTVFSVMHAFGSTGATLGNISTGDGMASLFGDGLSGLGDLFSGAGDLGDALGSMCDCCPGDVGDALNGMCSAHENALDACFGDCGNCLGGCCDSVGQSAGQLFESCASCPGDAAASCGDCLSGCGSDPCGSLVHLLGDVGGELGSCCEPLSHCCSGVTGSAGDCIGSCTSEYGSFLSNGLACDGCGGLGEGLGSACEATGSCLEGTCGAMGDVVGCLGEVLGSLGGLDL